MADAAGSPAPESATVTATVFVFHDGTVEQRLSLEAAGNLVAPGGVDLRLVDEVVGPDDTAQRNRTIGRSRGRYIAVVDAGSTPDVHWLNQAIARLRDDPTLGFVAATEERDGLVIDPPVTMFVARRTMWEAVGGFDETVTSAVQGLSLGWRCWLTGWRAAVTVADGAAPTVGTVSRRDLDVLASALLASPGRGGRSLGRRRRWRSDARRAMQRARRRPDAEIGALLARAAEHGGVAAELRDVIRANGAGRIFETRRRVVVATADTLAPSMAGPAIRAWQIASALARDHDVHLVTTGTCELTGTDFPTEAVTDERFAELVAAADVVLFQGWVMADRPWLVRSDVVIVADIYDPMHLEQLEHGRDATAEGGRWEAVSGATAVLNQQLERGDYFLCASDKQRDLWLGQMAAVGRINQVTYDEDNSYAERMCIVPFGIEDGEPRQARHAIRDSHPEIGADDEIILWGGGIYNWFDPVTLIHAVDDLRRRRPDVRLYFLGTKHPNPEIPEMRMAAQARALASELGLDGTHVFFNDGWVPYAQRADYLLDADVAVSIHRAHIETEFSFRTRLLDYLWCGLPIVATAGDSFEPLIVERELGVVVPPGDVDAVADALESLLADPDRRAAASANARAAAEQFRWAEVLEPIRAICANPTRAPDVACPDTASTTVTTAAAPPRWRADLALARRYLSEGGVSLLVGRVRSRFDRLRSRQG